MRLAAATALAVVLLGACGEDAEPQEAAPTSASPSESASPEPEDSSSAESPSESPSQSPSQSAPPDAPDCAEVWQADAHIPRFYQGCMEGEKYVEREARACSSGQRLLHYRNFYGVPGGTAHEGTKPLSKDPGFRRAAIECVA